MSFDGQTPGVYSAPQDALLNPSYCGSLFVQRASGAPDLEILPAAPLGKLWVVLNANVVVEGAGVPSWSFREVVPGEVVRPVDVRTGTTPGSYLQIGSLAVRGPLNFLNTGATTVSYTATVLALPASLMQRFWMMLTDVFAAVPFEPPPADKVLRIPFGGFQQSTNSPLWVNNTDVAGRTVEFRFTRAGVAVVVPCTAASSTNTRGSLLFPASAAWPPLLSGDLLEARVTTAPGAPVYFGGMLQAVPLISLT
jgi:hypothetical protein